jgi:predicted GNAT family acetyltransferase
VGFRVRSARRIEQGRVWVWNDEAGLVFKADVLAETPEAVYLEGIHVRAEERGKGLGLRCMSQLGHELLRGADAVCLVVSERSEGAQAFYRKSGYRFLGYYDTIYLQPRGGN